MTSLRAQIEAKQRRRTKLVVLVGDVEAAAAEVETFRAALNVHQQQVAGRLEAGQEPTEADAAEEERLRQDLADARARASGTVAQVELQALEPDDWDALFATVEPDETGELDLSEIHAVALAASCVDPELQDETWWKEQLARPVWSKGDRAAISLKLLELNLWGPQGDPGKG